MGIVFRQSIKTGIVTFAGALLGLLVVYLSAVYIPKQELGFSRTLLQNAVIGSQLVLMGMHTTLYTLIYKYTHHDERRKLLITLSLLVPIALTVAYTILYFIFRDRISLLFQPQDVAYVNRYFIWLPLYTFLWSMIILLEQYLGSQMKVAASGFMKEIVLRVANILLIFLFGYGLIDFHMFIIYSVLVHFIPVLFLYLLARQTEGFGISVKWKLLSRAEFKSIADFAFFHLFLNVSVILLVSIDTIMLASLDKTGVEAVAVYFVAGSILSIYQIPYRAMGSASTPMLNKAYESKNHTEVEDMFSRAGVNILIVTMGMAAVIIPNLQNAVLLLGEQYKSIALVVLILMVGRTADMAAGLNNEMLSISKHYRFNFYLTAALVIVIIIFNLLLIPKYGIYGAAWSSSLALCVYNVIKLLFLWFKMQLQPFSKGSLLVIPCFFAAAGIGYILPFIKNPIIDASVRSATIIIIYAVLILIFKPSPDITSYLNTVKNNKRLF